MQKQIWAYEESRPFADLSEREGDVDEHEDDNKDEGNRGLWLTWTIVNW